MVSVNFQSANLTFSHYLKYIFKFYLAKGKLYLRLETQHDASQASVYPTVATTAVDVIWEALVM